MNIQLKPGNWKTRDGRKAVVEFRTECPGITICKWFGYVGGEFHRWDDFGNSACPGPNSDFDLISPWTEPKLRPWTPEEVPVGAVIRNKTGSAYRSMIIGVTDEGWVICPFNDRDQARMGAKPESLLEYQEHSLDGGKTWLPCGVMEGEA